MANVGPLFSIDAPPLSPPPNGLLAAAPVIDQTDERWMNGVTFTPENCNNATTFDPCSTVMNDVVLSVADGVTNTDTSLTSALAAFNVTDKGKVITGTGIPVGTTIASVTNATTVVLSATTTATATGVTITIVNRTPPPNRRTAVTFLPFGVEAYDTCSTFGYERSDHEGRARRALAARESKAVEYEFATGVRIAANRHLQDDTNTTKLFSSAAVGPKLGLSGLVQAAADNNLGVGMIHARPGLVQVWASMGLLYRDGKKLLTFTGHQVVSGSGYPGASPAGVAPTATSEWAYITDPVQVNRGQIETFGAENGLAGVLDRTNNEITMRATRMYSVVFNACAVVAVQINPVLTT